MLETLWGIKYAARPVHQWHWIFSVIGTCPSVFVLMSLGGGPVQALSTFRYPFNPAIQ